MSTSPDNFAAVAALQESLTSFTNLCDLAAETAQFCRCALVANDQSLRNTNLDKNSPHVDAAAIGFNRTDPKRGRINGMTGEGAMDRPRCSACFSVGFPYPLPSRAHLIDPTIRTATGGRP